MEKVEHLGAIYFAQELLERKQLRLELILDFHQVS